MAAICLRLRATSTTTSSVNRRNDWLILPGVWWKPWKRGLRKYMHGAPCRIITMRWFSQENCPSYSAASAKCMDDPRSIGTLRQYAGTQGLVQLRGNRDEIGSSLLGDAELCSP